MGAMAASSVTVSRATRTASVPSACGAAETRAEMSAAESAATESGLGSGRWSRFRYNHWACSASFRRGGRRRHYGGGKAAGARRADAWGDHHPVAGSRSVSPVVLSCHDSWTISS